LKEMRFNSTTF